jgi:cytochrome c553
LKRQSAIFAVSLVALATLAGCGSDDFEPYDVCAPLTDAQYSALPAKLSEAGLFADIKTEQLADRVWLYKPRFTLWTDGATKRRWISMPAGKAVDVSDMDDWRFPVGTKLFKEFVRDGVRVETRLLLKTGSRDADWSMAAYIWDQSQTDATLALDGGTNQLGTPHDVPAAAKCTGCHGGRASRSLGFSAVQMAWQPPQGFVTVAELQTAGVLPGNVPRTLALPGTETDQQALGYLHANCSHCHNKARPAQDGPRCFDPQQRFDLALPSTALLNVADAPAYKTSVQEGVLTPGNARRSALVKRLSDGDPRMPALGTEVIDETGRALLTKWVDSL